LAPDRSIEKHAQQKELVDKDLKGRKPRSRTNGTSSKEDKYVLRMSDPSEMKCYCDALFVEFCLICFYSS
jgi:hypothetical protein